MPNLYFVQAMDSDGELVGTEYLLASSWKEAKRKASPHWPTGADLWARVCSKAELELYLEFHCP